MLNSKKTVNIGYPIIHKSNDIESILCLSSLLASGILSVNNHWLDDSENYYNSLEKGCIDCKIKSQCLACMINE